VNLGPYLADSYGNPLDNIDSVSALVPDFFALSRLCLSGYIRRPGTELILAGGRVPLTAPRCPAVASDRTSQDSLVPTTATIRAEFDPLDRAETGPSTTFYGYPSGLYVPLAG
jgi:hypothetical protein